MTDLCTTINVRHDPPQPVNNFEKFSDDFVSDFHKAQTQEQAVSLAQTFLSQVQQYPELEQQIMLARAQQSDAGSGCGLDIPRLDVGFMDDGRGGQTLEHLDVTTTDASKTWHFGIAELTYPHTIEIYGPNAGTTIR
jgi:hypothetical protein